MGKSAIQWTDVTDNVIVAVDADGQRHGWWCRKISPGCAHCYAEDLNDSDYFHGNHLPYSGEAPVLKLREDIIDGWVRQRKAKKHFVMSMSDVFGEWVPRAWIFRFLDGMRAAARQIFQVLTKRADVMLREVRAWLEARGLGRVPTNIWLGVSVENQRFADERIPLLLQIPCDVRFLSVEPILGSVDLERWLDAYGPASSALPCDECGSVSECDHDIGPATIAWVIVGGESGSKARPSFVSHVRSVVKQCVKWAVAVFVKQLGADVRDRNDAGFDGDEDDSWPQNTAHESLDERGWQGDPVRVRLRDRKGGDILEFPRDLRVRQFPVDSDAPVSMAVSA